ncbi:hypothetical protein GGF46_000402 [Coemansia sp. RSA 552]|nr:hypothetical protein GGF46_000402 [Coemansia sp. RSA 552]
MIDQAKRTARARDARADEGYGARDSAASPAPSWSTEQADRWRVAATAGAATVGGNRALAVAGQNNGAGQNNQGGEYADRFGSYYDYVSELLPEPGAPASALSRPALRSTYKSEPMIGAAAAAAAAGGERVSYSQMLETALFYSQAIEEMHESAEPAPRVRPGKDDIRQRRARNAIASREMFNTSTPSTFIPLPASKVANRPPLPPVPASAPVSVSGRSLAMRSEPEFKRYVSEPSHPASTGGGGGRPAVPISRILGRGVSRTAAGGGSGSRAPSIVSSAGTVPHAYASSVDVGGRRAGMDRREAPSSESLGADSVKPRGGGSPQTFSSSLRAPVRRRASASDRDTEAATRRSRRSTLSHFSSVAESVRAPPSILPSGHGPSHSRRVATRLLMRAGLSRIAIRVAQAGSVAGNDAQASLAAGADIQASSLFGSDVGLDDPNGLRALQAERRKQVQRVDEYGFMHFDGDDALGTEQAQRYDEWVNSKGGRRSAAARSEGAASLARWEALLDGFDAETLRGSRKVKSMVQAGVAPGARARFYYVLSGAATLEQPGRYGQLTAASALPIYDVIERDVSRSYPDHVLFADDDSAGQRQLRRVLRAYAHYNQAVGYCQGMGRLVGLFLIVGLPEEHAFWALAATIANFIPHFYDSDLAGLRQHSAVFEALLRERNPPLAAHLANNGCDSLMYATPWFMTVFTLSLPWPTALRVWDWFLYRGVKTLFRTALAITDLASPYLLDACPTIAEQLGFLLHIPGSLVDADSVIAAAQVTRLHDRYYSVADETLSQIPAAVALQTKTGVPKVYAAAGLGLFGVILVFFNIGAALLVNLTGFGYAAYATMNAIESPGKEDDAQWLTYWVVFGLFNVAEYFTGFLLYWIPFFYLFKLAFLVWLMLPTTRGAERLYLTVIKPTILHAKAPSPPAATAAAAKASGPKTE